MRLNWFSPLPPAETEIAQYTLRILPSLSERAELVLWTDQAEWEADLESQAEVRFFRPEEVPWSELNRADATVYHIGNNPLFHVSIWQVSRRHPGVVVLHDLRLQHFFTVLYGGRWRDREGYLTQMELHHGADGRRAAEVFWDRGCSIEQLAECYPLTTLALENAIGALVHTPEAFDELKREERWPVAYLRLPYLAAARPRRSALAQVPREGPPFRLIVFGHIGSNRRLDELLQALSELPEREGFRLDVYGRLQQADHFRERLETLGLKRLVRLHGFVPEAELEAALRMAHLAVNMRYPSMGEASASQLRIWNHALPSLVTRVGWFAHLPENAVAFVHPENEVGDIKAHLRALLSDPTHFAWMGENGRRFLEEHHRVDAYSQALVDFVADARRFRPRAAALVLAERVGAEMSAWMPQPVPEKPVRKAAEEIIALAAGPAVEGE
jgi:glycosyltransferase involved in cell wall biosynthesis